MNIFFKRPLCLILSLGIGSFAVFAKFGSVARLTVLLASLLLLIFSMRARAKTRTRMISLIASGVMLLSMLFAHVYFDLWFYADCRFHGNISAYGEVYEVERSEYYGTVTVKAESIQGKPFSKYKIRISTDRETADSLDIGDTVCFGGRLTRVSSEYAKADGVNAAITENSSLELVKRRSSVPLKDTLYYLRANFSRYAISITDKESGALLAALLSGDKSYLTNTVILDFRRIGVSHILALSGMHLAILTVGINKLLRLLRLGKTTRLSASALFAVGYAVFTGLPITVIRAGIMLLICSLLSFFKRAHDSTTSLAITLAIIFIATPYAVFDVGLWLSALATLGVIMAAQYYRDMPITDSKFKKSIRALGSAVLCSVFAISATIFITSTEFGTLSLAAPLATLLLSFLIELIMYLGTVTLIVGRIIPLGRVVGALSHLTLKIAGAVSDIDGVLVSTREPILYILTLILSVAVFGFFIIKMKNPTIGVIAVSSVFAFTFIFAGALSFTARSKTVMQYYSTEKDDVIYMQSKQENAVINFASYSESSGYYAAEAILANNSNELDKYVYTRYYRGILEDFTVLSSNVNIDFIYVPTPENADEQNILKQITTAISDTRSEIKIYSPSDMIAVGEMLIKLHYRTPYGKSALTALEINHSDRSTLYLSSGMLKGNTHNTAKELIPESDTVIFGSHGKSYTSGYYYDLHFPRTSMMIFSSTNLFITRNNYNYHKNNGCEIYSHPSAVDLLK